MFHLFILNKELFPNLEFAVFDTQIECFIRNTKNDYKDKCNYLYEEPNFEKILQNYEDNIMMADYVLISTQWSFNDVLFLEKHIIPYLKAKNKQIILTSNTHKFFFEIKTPWTLLDVKLKNFHHNVLSEENIDSLRGIFYNSRVDSVVKLNIWLKKIALDSEITFLDKEAKF
jgi:hypothetical protein